MDSAAVKTYLLELQELRRVIEPAGVRLAAERATDQDIDELEQAYAGMKDAVDNGGDYVRHDLRFHQALLRACHNRMLVQMSKALGALLRTSFVISTARPDCAAKSLPLHRAVLDAVIARSPAKAEKAIQRGLTYLNARREVWFQHGPVEEGDLPAQDIHIAGGPNVVSDDIGKPQEVIGDPRADSRTARWMPPVLDIPGRELAGRGAQEVFAHQTRS